jgi:hypothetical protein
MILIGAKVTSTRVECATALPLLEDSPTARDSGTVWIWSRNPGTGSPLLQFGFAETGRVAATLHIPFEAVLF